MLQGWLSELAELLHPTSPCPFPTVLVLGQNIPGTSQKIPTENGSLHPLSYLVLGHQPAFLFLPCRAPTSATLSMCRADPHSTAQSFILNPFCFSMMTILWMYLYIWFISVFFKLQCRRWVICYIKAYFLLFSYSPVLLLWHLHRYMFSPWENCSHKSLVLGSLWSSLGFGELMQHVIANSTQELKVSAKLKSFSQITFLQ